MLNISNLKIKPWSSGQCTGLDRYIRVYLSLEIRHQPPVYMLDFISIMIAKVLSTGNIGVEQVMPTSSGCFQDCSPSL